MKITNAALLELVNTHGIDIALNDIDIEKINDLPTKIICRTLQYSKEQLIKTLMQNDDLEKKLAPENKPKPKQKKKLVKTSESM